jgi:dethiobiotin synthetase
LTTTPQLRLIFVTGTDTGVGKTLLTSLLLCHLRAAGCPALALKPFCSGSRADAELLGALQDGELTLDEINPFYFAEPVAPLVAARKHRRSIRVPDVLARIRTVATSLSSRTQSKIKNQKSKIETPVLLIEGSGGLLVPLAEDFAVRDLIVSLRCEVVVVAHNRLGTINHTLLTVKALNEAARKRTRRFASPVKVVMMEPRVRDASSATNLQVLSELLRPVPVFALDYLGANCRTRTAIRKSAMKLKRTLNRILG